MSDLVATTLNRVFILSRHIFHTQFLMYRPIKEAFDAGFLCFILGPDGEHHLHLLDTRLSNVKLTDMEAYPWLKPSGQEKLAKDGTQQDFMRDVTQ